jgi:hypothetical protein
MWLGRRALAAVMLGTDEARQRIVSKGIMTTAPSRVYLNRADAGTPIEFTVNAHGGRVADATEVTQAVAAVAERSGPVHSRLERGQTPVIFDDDHVLDLDSRGVPVLGSATFLGRVVLS